MEFKHTIEVLCTQAEEINNIAKKLQSGKGLRRIELDLLLEKLRDIYDLAQDLEATIGGEPGGEQEQEGKAKKPKEKSEEKPEPEGGTVLELEEQEPATEERAAPGKKAVEKAEASSDLVSDRLGKGKRILHEEISEKTKSDDISAQYKSSPISSIASAIGVNERFELINELFGGDREKFDKTIEVLNMADSFVEAYNYLEENFEWDMDNSYVQRILELIRRKLIVRRNEQ